MRSINNLERKAAGMTKRERFPALKKKDLREERLLLAFFLPRPPPSGPPKKEAEWIKERDKGGLACAKAAGSGVEYSTKERVALLGGQLCDNTTEKAALSCNMLWSQRPYEVVMSFTRSKPGPRAVRKIGRNLSGTTHPTLPPIGGRPSYSRPKRNCSDLE
ncbi:hypothetical protein L1987_89183 [Smallanthus sonchifolius]|nr:hypothetical protein L1987_89183 [Smallanthus sonchifolius]